MFKSLNIIPKVYFKNAKHLSTKIFIDGKSYKISLKPTVGNMRFNRANRTILVFQNMKFTNKNEQKKLYVLNSFLSKTSMPMMLKKIRGANTYTQRGLWSTCRFVPKRAGRISEYM